MTTTSSPAVGTHTSHAITLSVDTSCQTLGLPSVRANHARMATEAAKARLTHAGYLAELLAVEVDDRHTRRITRRIAEAKFPRHKRLSLSLIHI